MMNPWRSNAKPPTWDHAATMKETLDVVMRQMLPYEYPPLESVRSAWCYPLDGYERVACIVDPWCPDEGIWLVMDDGMARTAGLKRGPFMLGSVRGYGAHAARCMAQAYKPEGL